jgi:MSHA pilin protein MshD
MKTLRPRPRRTGKRAGFGLLETSVATLLVGAVLVTSMQTVAAVSKHRGGSSQSTTASLLADELLSEILEKEYKEPTQTPTFGPESGETNKTLYDDVDDYNGLNESPPKYNDNTSMTSLAGWTRDVTVTQVAATDPIFSTTIRVGTTAVGVGLASRGSNTDTGVRKVVVNVRKNGTILATVSGLRCDMP